MRGTGGHFGKMFDETFAPLNMGVGRQDGGSEVLLRGAVAAHNKLLVAGSGSIAAGPFPLKVSKHPRPPGQPATAG